MHEMYSNSCIQDGLMTCDVICVLWATCVVGYLYTGLHFVHCHNVCKTFVIIHV